MVKKWAPANDPCSLFFRCQSTTSAHHKRVSSVENCLCFNGRFNDALRVLYTSHIDTAQLGPELVFVFFKLHRFRQPHVRNLVSVSLANAEKSSVRFGCESVCSRSCQAAEGLGKCVLHLPSRPVPVNGLVRSQSRRASPMTALTACRWSWLFFFRFAGFRLQLHRFLLLRMYVCIVLRKRKIHQQA